MKQMLMFDAEKTQGAVRYSSKIEAPIYEPDGPKPHLLSLCDDSRAKSLIREIDESDIPEDEKTFLRLAAYRHIVFNYELIANYYAHSSVNTQRLMESSALVIIDFDKAIELGFVRLCENIKNQYLEEYDTSNSAES